MRLSTTFNLECSHQIEQPIGVPVLHGHSYLVTLSIRSSAVNPVPLPQLQGYAGLLRSRLDHKHLNEVLADPPTMEAIIAFILEHWRGPRLMGVKVERPTVGASAEWGE